MESQLNKLVSEAKESLQKENDKIKFRLHTLKRVSCVDIYT